MKLYEPLKVSISSYLSVLTDASNFSHVSIFANSLFLFFKEALGHLDVVSTRG